MSGDGRNELVAVESQQGRVFSRLHGRRPRNVAEQGDLPERLSGPEIVQLLAVGDDPDAPGFDHVEEIAVVALAEDHLSAFDLPLLDSAASYLCAARSGYPRIVNSPKLSAGHYLARRSPVIAEVLNIISLQKTSLYVDVSLRKDISVT